MILLFNTKFYYIYSWNQHVRKIPDRKEAVGVVIKKTRDTLQVVISRTLKVSPSTRLILQ